MLRWATALLFLVPSLPALANTHKSDAWAHSQFSIAEHKRESLEALSPQQQTRREYQDVINSYRRVYYGSPTSTKADASVIAVADAMAEMGRRFHDTSVLHSAIGQYEFLRKEYPGSKYRFDALFKIGQIYGDDLNDGANARKTLEEFVKRYPANHLASEVHAKLANAESQSASDSKEDASAIDSVEKATPEQELEAKERTASVGKKADAESEKPAHISTIRYRSNAGSTQVEIDLDHAVDFTSQRIDSPDRIFFDLNAKLAKKLVGKDFDVDNDLLKKIRVAQFKPQRARIVLEIGEHSDFNASVQENPARLIIALKDSRLQRAQSKDKNSTGSTANVTLAEKRDAANTQDAILAPPSLPNKRIVEAGDDDDNGARATSRAKPTRSAMPYTPSYAKSGAKDRRRSLRQVDVREAQPTANGDRSLIRALGLKIGKIVIDPGHGGYDTGTIGPNSLEEKDLVLDVSKRLGKLLESRLGAQVVYTRKDDTFIPLETRTAIANQEKADLFVSVHANSSHDPTARGVETYYLNFSSSPDALEVAARENAVSETSIHELQDLVKQIALKEKIEESREFATDVQQELHSGLAARNPGLRNRGVKKAPFIVLIGANMPSILAEISFVSNPGDERRLETAEYRQRIAESLYRGISKYVGGLSGVKVASKIEKTSGQ